jgi:hypothetical protein
LPDRLPPPPFWRTGYFDAAMARPDRQAIDLDDVKRGLEQPTYNSVQPDGETVHNAFFDRNFRP